MTTDISVGVRWDPLNGQANEPMEVNLVNGPFSQQIHWPNLTESYNIKI
mgnify:CR=1 FL=1